MDAGLSIRRMPATHLAARESPFPKADIVMYYQDKCFSNSLDTGLTDKYYYDGISAGSCIYDLTPSKDRQIKSVEATTKDRLPAGVQCTLRVFEGGSETKCSSGESTHSTVSAFAAVDICIPGLFPGKKGGFPYVRWDCEYAPPPPPVHYPSTDVTFFFLLGCKLAALDPLTPLKYVDADVPANTCMKTKANFLPLLRSARASKPTIQIPDGHKCELVFFSSDTCDETMELKPSVRKAPGDCAQGFEFVKALGYKWACNPITAMVG